LAILSILRGCLTLTVAFAERMVPDRRLGEIGGA
jgi:hypothetical protein